MRWNQFATTVALLMAAGCAHTDRTSCDAHYDAFAAVSAAALLEARFGDDREAFDFDPRHRGMFIAFGLPDVVRTASGSTRQVRQDDIYWEPFGQRRSRHVPEMVWVAFDRCSNRAIGLVLPTDLDLPKKVENPLR